MAQITMEYITIDIYTVKLAHTWVAKKTPFHNSNLIFVNLFAEITALGWN